MSATAPPRFVPLRTGPRRFPAILCVLLLLACLAALVLDGQERRGWAEVARTAKLPAQQPAIWATAGIIDDNAEAGLVVAEGVLDASGPGRGVGAVSSGDSRAAARGVILDGLERRPGSVHALSLLGRTTSPGDPVAHWSKPLGLATAAAPGLDFAADELGRRYLEAWDRLSPPEQKKAEEALRQAFRDPAFVDSGFPTAVGKLGPERAVGLVPDESLSLSLAARFLEARGFSAAYALAAARLKALPAGRTSRTVP